MEEIPIIVMKKQGCTQASFLKTYIQLSLQGQQEQDARPQRQPWDRMASCSRLTPQCVASSTGLRTQPKLSEKSPSRSASAPSQLNSLHWANSSNRNGTLLIYPRVSACGQGVL